MTNLSVTTDYNLSPLMQAASAAAPQYYYPGGNSKGQGFSKAMQSGVTVTDPGAVFTSAMIGGVIIFCDNATHDCISLLILDVPTSTTLTVSQSQTLSTAASYIIWYGGVQFDQFGNFSAANIVGPTTASFITSSATPGTVRAFRGKITDTATTMTSGNIVGLRGEVDLVGASGGFVYGVQGKVIPTGTLSGSLWAPAVFGQYDISAATVNGAQLACIWGDMGTTSGTMTDASGVRMFAGTNTTAATLNSMIYLYGKTSNLLELDANGSTYISTGGATASGTIKKIAILIEGVQYYLQAATAYS